MKIKVWCDSGANIHSCREDIIDLAKDWNISDEEWKQMSEEEKQNEVDNWAYDRLDIGWKEC